MWDDARQMNAISAVLALFAALVLLWGGLAWLLRQPMFAFREVVIQVSPERASAAHLEAAIRGELAGSFFTMNLDRARGAFARVPWVRAVALRRQWPQRLEVTIEEHVPLARWNDGGLVNTHGEVFVADWNGELPQFRGPADTAAAMTARYREWTARLAPLDLRVRGIVLSPRGGWEIRAERAGAPLSIALGRDDVDARLARLIGAYPRTLDALARAGRPVERVDLRYRNGFAARVPGALDKPTRKT